MTEEEYPSERVLGGEIHLLNEAVNDSRTGRYSESSDYDLAKLILIRLYPQIQVLNNKFILKDSVGNLSNLEVETQTGKKSLETQLFTSRTGEGRVETVYANRGNTKEIVLKHLHVCNKDGTGEDYYTIHTAFYDLITGAREERKLLLMEIKSGGSA